MAKKKVKRRTRTVTQEKVEYEKTEPAKELTPDEIKANKTKELRERFGDDLYVRATLSKNKIGMTDEQLDTYTDPNALKMVCDNIKPRVTPQESTMRRKPPIPRRKKGVKATVELESVITVDRAQYVQRSSYDESEMRGRLMRLRIPYESVQSVVFNRNNIPDMRKRLTTKITVNYLK